jgi:tripartite-type tricarboxylate transporter receptor subunit TctC
MNTTFLTRRTIIALGSAFMVTLLTLGQVSAQSRYPSKDIKFIVPYSPGAAGDILSRKYTELLGKILNTTVIVSNVPGGSGSIGTVEIFGAQPDGYTIGYGHNSPLAIQPHKSAALPYSGVDDFTPIGGIGHEPTSLSVNSKSKWQTFADFVASAKADPGGISIAVGGAGNVKDMQLQQFQKASGVEFNIVPFAGGGAEAVVAAMGGIVDAVAVSSSSVRGQIQSGDLRPLGVIANSTEDKIDGFEVINAEKYPGMRYLQDSSGVIGPKRIPAEIVAILEAAHQQIMKNPEFLAMLKANSYIIDPADAKQYRQQLLADFANFGKIYGK